MQPLDPIRLPLSGRHLIEASAGTGKTYTITGLYLRLLMERELTPDQILVVTYTEAACQELREKIRARLVAALALFESGSTSDRFLAALLAAYQAEGRDLQRLQGLVNLALINFDLAAVFTIHGFCMRVLQESAFESGFPFETEFVEDDHDLLQQVIDDYWRHHSAAWPEVVVADLHRAGISPDTLPNLLRLPLRAVQTRGMAALAHGPTRAPDAIDLGLMPRLRALWLEERAEIVSLLTASPALGRSEKTFRQDRLAAWFTELDDCLGTRSTPPSPDADGNGETPPWLVPPLTALASLSQGALIAGTKPRQAGQTPTHPFFALAEQLITELAEVRRGLVVGLIEHGGPALRALKATAGLVTFDDLLTGLRAGLRAEEGGQALAARVRGQYPVALIDEFQDTDPVQYEIFTTIFQGEEGCLFMVGDPKQAIYGFRGADIFSYLQAANADQGRGHTLTTNWRAEPALIRACNALFAGHEAPFLLPGLEFRPVMSPERTRRRLVLTGMDLAALTLLTFGDEEGRDQAKLRVAHWLALAVQGLLTAASRGEAYFEEWGVEGEVAEGEVSVRPLSAGDIAILVRNHREGERVQEALARVGLTAVTSSRQSVFASEEARELAAILAAVASPADERQVRRALATRLLGYDALELVRQEEDESVWEATLERFSGYHRRWLGQGVAAMLNHLWAKEGVLPRVAAQGGGERRLTNLRHLLELLQEASDTEALGPPALLRWLGERRLSDRPGEASLLRLESDENLIKIVTVHKSKGLQYPVVIAPFFWDSSFMDRKTPEVIECHGEDGALLVDLGSAGFAQNRLRQRRERLAEEMRLLYVALTRAENRCLLFWGRVRSGRQRWATASSPLHYLLSARGCPDPDLIAALEEGFGEQSAAELLAPFDAIARESLGAIRRVEADSLAAAATPIAAATPVSGEARRFQRPLHPYLGLHSFSSLHHAALEIEAPDHDSVGVETGHREQGPLAVRDIFSFPRGAQAGSCLHAILEGYDFQVPDQAGLETMIRDKLALFGLEREWSATVLGLLSRLVATPLDPESGLSLAAISRGQRLDELEFYFSLPPVSDQALRTMVREGLALAPEGAGRQGFMKGFIDLVFEWQGRYYIVDYKSNYLGGTLADYGQENLALAMRHSGYDLQYRIYTLALDRYLGRRLPGYDYERHFGGVYYLFLRGLDPEQGPEFGVYHARPERPQISS